MANPFYDAVQDLEKAKKLIQDTIDGLNNAMQIYEQEAGGNPEHGKPPSSQLPAE